LNSLTVPITTSGVALGHDDGGRPVLVRLFGPQPTTVAYVGGWWAVQVVIHRCLAIGATVIVDALSTDSPTREGTLAGQAQWLTLGRLTGSPTRRVRPAMGGEAQGSATWPVLHVHDVGPTGPVEAPPPAPWVTHLTVLSRVTPASRSVIADVDIVLTQRLDPREATLVAAARLLPPEFPAKVGATDHEAIAACGAGTVRFINLYPTSTERQLFG
jgi:hypothetical protein